MALADRFLADEFILGRRSVGYGRISDDGEEQLSSLHNQIEFFEEFFDEAGFQMKKDCGMYHKRDGSKIFLAGIYADEGISGVSLRRRDAFNRMIEDAKARLFDVIVVKSIARFARDVENGYPIIKDLADLGVAVYFLDNNLSSLDPTADSKIIDGLKNAQEESRSKSRNVQFGLRRSQKKGKWTGKTMYGFDREKGYLKPNIYQLCVVKDIAYLYYIESFGGQRIKHYLEGAGVLAPSGKKTWGVDVIMWILSNPIYAGLQVQHTVKMVDVNRNRRKKIDPSKWIVTYRPELAIFTFDHWNSFQEERQRRGGPSEYLRIYEVDGEPKVKLMKGKPTERNQPRHSSTHLFSNLIVCGNCGATFRRRNRNKKQIRHKWSCAKYERLGLQGCKGKSGNSINEDDLLEHVKQELIKFRSNKEEREWYLNAFLKVKFPSVDPSVLEKLEETLATLEKRYFDTMDMLSDGKGQKALLQKRLDDLQNRLEKAQEEKRSILNREQDIKKVKLNFNEFMNFLHSVDVEDLQNGVLRKIIEQIQITTDEVKAKRGENAISIDISWKFIDKSENDISWNYMGVEYNEWKRNVLYADMTKEEIEAEEERITMQEEFERTPEGQQHLREMDELRQESFEQGQRKQRAKK